MGRPKPPIDLNGPVQLMYECPAVCDLCGRGCNTLDQAGGLGLDEVGAQCSLCFEVVSRDRQPEHLVVKTTVGVKSQSMDWDGAAVVEYKQDHGWQLDKVTAITKKAKDAGGSAEDLLNAAGR